MKSKPVPPLHVAWEITARCNARCLHCCAASGPEVASPELDTRQALGIIDQLADLGVRVLAFSGGEPLLREDLTHLIQQAAARGLKTSVCTNGSLVDDGMALRLKAAGLDNITVSLDGACAETHERLRNFPGLFDRAVAAIRTLVRHGHRTGVSFTPTKANYQEAAEVVQLACRLGVNSVCLSQYIPTGRGPRELMLDPDTLASLSLAVSRLQAEYAKRLQILCHDCHAALQLPPAERADSKGCGAGTATAGIRADGAVTPCIFMPTEAGNLNASSFAEIWHDSPVLHAVRDRELLTSGNCGACEFKLVCGGCRAAATAIHGNPLAGDPTCWLFPESPDMTGQPPATRMASLP